MVIEIIQKCDRCKKSRKLSDNTSNQKLREGWRVVPVDCRFGSSREEQPSLCPNCCKEVLSFIRQGVNSDSN